MLYKHVDSLADLAHRIAILAWTEFGDAIRDATRAGQAGTPSPRARKRCGPTSRSTPARYAAANAAQPAGPDDPLIAATARVMAPGAAMLRGYQLDPSQEIHALRMLRSTIHGFTTLEVTGGFQIDADIDDSFTWTVNFIDHGLQASTAASTDNPRPPAHAPLRRPRCSPYRDRSWRGRRGCAPGVPPPTGSVSRSTRIRSPR